MTRYPLVAAAALAVAFAAPATATHGPYCVSSPEQVIWCSPAVDDPTKVCLNTTDEWCSASATEILHGEGDLTDMPGAICAYTHDGGWCSPALEDHVTELCVYPYDGGWCVPWVNLPPL
jgi:hypothetical protein